MRYSTSGCGALRSILRPAPISSNLFLLNKTFLVKRCIATGTKQLDRMPGSLFGWNPFAKKKTEQDGTDANNGQQKESEPASVIDVESKIVDSAQSKKEPLEEKVAEWVPLDETLDQKPDEPEKNIILSKMQISQIFYKEIRNNHPDASENLSDEELLSLSISDPLVKLKVLPPLEDALNLASKGKLYNYPNRNLNNSQTVKDVHYYYLVQDEMTGALNRFPLEKHFRDLKEKAETDPAESLPPNLLFTPWVPKVSKPKIPPCPGSKHIPQKVKFAMSKKVRKINKARKALASMIKKKGRKWRYNGPPRHLRSRLLD